jgi:hypothetical protein
VEGAGAESFRPVVLASHLFFGAPPGVDRNTAVSRQFEQFGSYLRLTGRFAKAGSDATEGDTRGEGKQGQSVGIVNIVADIGVKNAVQIRGHVGL